MATTQFERTSHTDRPVMTFVIAAITAIVSVIALLDAPVMDLFVRNRPLLESGQWWRTVTPVLVQPDGWGQFAFNLLGVVVVGAAVERRVGSCVCAVTFVVGGVGSVAMYSAWHPADTGGGSSAAVAALIGLLTVGIATRPDRSRFGELAQLYSLFFAAYLTALDVGGILAAIVVGNAAIPLTILARRFLKHTNMSWMTLVLIVTAGIVMTVVHDDHGAGILIGLVCAMMAQLRRRWPGNASSAS